MRDERDNFRVVGAFKSARRIRKRERRGDDDLAFRSFIGRLEESAASNASELRVAYIRLEIVAWRLPHGDSAGCRAETISIIDRRSQPPLPLLAMSWLKGANPHPALPNRGERRRSWSD